MYLKHDEEIDLTTITTASHFKDYVYQIGKGICTSQFPIQSGILMTCLKLYPLKYIEGIDSLLSLGRRNHLKKIGYPLNPTPLKF